LELPYKGNELSMLVLLPKAKSGLADVEKSLSKEKIAALQADLRQQRVDVYLPKFKLETAYRLKDTLKAMA